MIKSLLLFLLPVITHANVPFLIELGPGDTKCIYYDIAPSDDASFGFAAIAISEEQLVRVYLQTKLKKGMSENEDTKNETWKKDIPLEIKEALAYTKRKSADIKVEIFNPDDKRVWYQSLNYAEPTVVKALKSSLHPMFLSTPDEEDEDSGLYRTCFGNYSEDIFNVFFHAVSVTEQRKEDEYNQVRQELNTKNKAKETEKYRNKFLSPIEQTLNGLEQLAQGVVNDLKYVQAREERMRETSQSTQSRVHLFSYISLVLVVAVTIGQTFYFRDFFKKKKLM